MQSDDWPKPHSATELKDLTAGPAPQRTTYISLTAARTYLQPSKVYGVEFAAPPPSMANLNPDTLFIALVILSSYSLAGCLMEHFAVFHAWTLTSTPLDLKTIQYHSGMRVFYVYVIPKSLTTVLTAYLAFTMGGIGTHQLVRPSLWWSFWEVASASWPFWCLACLTVSWVSSIWVQIPLQLEVRATANRVALRKLVSTNWVRVLAMVGHAGIVSYVALTAF